MDHLSRAKRSRNMAAIRSKNTKPEIEVRRFISKAGLRYRLHVARLPGKPDIVFHRYRAVIFVHGCFWHGHKQCYRVPKSNVNYWFEKIQGNIKRDRKHIRGIQKLGWRVFKIWECNISEQSVSKVVKDIKGGHLN